MSTGANNVDDGWYGASSSSPARLPSGEAKLWTSGVRPATNGSSSRSKPAKATLQQHSTNSRHYRGVIILFTDEHTRVAHEAHTRGSPDIEIWTPAALRRKLVYSQVIAY